MSVQKSIFSQNNVNVNENYPHSLNDDLTQELLFLKHLLKSIHILMTEY